MLRLAASSIILAIYMALGWLALRYSSIAFLCRYFDPCRFSEFLFFNKSFEFLDHLKYFVFCVVIKKQKVFLHYHRWKVENISLLLHIQLALNLKYLYGLFSKYILHGLFSFLKRRLVYFTKITLYELNTHITILNYDVNQLL